MSKRIKPSGITEWIFRIFMDKEDSEQRKSDFDEVFRYKTKTEGNRKAVAWYFTHLVRSIPSLFINSAYWGGSLFKNYIKIAYRNLKAGKLFSFINVTGLAIGIATCIIISLWVQRELSYDKFHSKADRIYRIERELFRDRVFSRWPITGGQYKQALIDDIPEIENSVRFWRREFTIKDHNNNVHTQGMFAADNSVFEIFDFGLEKGDQKTALLEPQSMVLTKANALKYFGTTDVIGKSLTFEYEDHPEEFEITGILNELPENSHIRFDMLMSISTYPDERFDSWRSNYLYTYVLLNKNADKIYVEEKLKDFVKTRLEPIYKDLLVEGYTIHEVLKMHLFPVTDIHLNPSVNWELEAGGNMVSVYLFSSIAIMILIIAGINFTNLSTARANKRAKEVSLRKTIGASPHHLRMQFLLESILMSLMALFVSIAILLLTIPFYNSIFDEHLTNDLLLRTNNIISLIGIALFIGILAGLYPAFYLTKFEPAGILRGSSFKGKNKSMFRRNLVIIQFSISITLIIGMVTVYNQMSYIQTRSIGFDQENVVTISASSSQITKSYDVFRNELLANNRIEAISSSADLPGDEFFSNGNVYSKENMDNNASMIFMFCDYDFIDTYKMEIIAGRKYSKEFSTDTAGTLILNQAAVRRLGWTPEEAVGKILKRGAPLVEYGIVGVVKDYNFRSLREEIEPMIMILSPGYISAISVRILPGEIIETIDHIERKWKEIFPGEQFEYNFIDYRINQLYQNEKNMQSLLIVFSVLSILVACLGLFGLAAYTAEEKTKEIGIRKTLGASISSILRLLTGEYLKWILISTLISWPLSYYLMDSWLQNFAYHIKLGWIPFVAAAGFSLVIALVTISVQVLKAAMANPVDSLRNE